MWNSVRKWVSKGRRRGKSFPLGPKSDNSHTLDMDFDQGDRSYKTRDRRKPWMIFGLASVFTLLFIILTVDIVLRLGRRTWPEDEDSAAESVLSHLGEAGSGADGHSWYSTDFLKEVVPKPIHSHNDYWRKVPLFTALQQGCIGVESDVWLFDGPERRDHLYVGHDEASLKPDRTFQSLYVQPLVDILTRQNPTTNSHNASARGVFDTTPNQTLILLVDVKTAGPETWTKVVEQLEPLRSRGWLTHLADGTVHSRPVTVVGTGNTPFDLIVQNTTYRDYFYDAPLGELREGRPQQRYDATNSYYASVSFGVAVGSTWAGGLSAHQVDAVRRQVGEAHGRGLVARYWDLPDWPVGLRDRVWDVLVEEGVDVLNVDDVKAAARRKWE